MLKIILDQLIGSEIRWHRRKDLPITVAKYLERRFRVKKLLNRYSVKMKIRERFNVVFSVIDCFRWDHSSMANYSRDTTPFMRKLAEGGLLFTNSYAPSSWTYPSVISLLTGNYPRRHGRTLKLELRNFLEYELPKKPKREMIFLSELLSSFDYRVLLASDIDLALLPIYDREPHCILYRKGMFDLSTQLRRNLMGSQKNFFLYLHLGNLHGPIQVPEPFQSAFGEIDRSIPTWSYSSGGTDSPGFIEYKENRIKLYDEALRYVDHIVKNIVAEIEEENEYPTIFVITADHGEEFWDHAQMEKELFYDPRGFWGVGHGHNLFQEIIRVPLIFYGGSIPSGIRKENVSLVDVFPTILDLLYIDHEIPSDGRTKRWK